MKHVLVAPLDWGLGHATRCIPLIRELISRKLKVSVAGSGSSLQLLKQEFPGLQYFELEPYDPEYPKTKTGMVWKMAFQIPKFYRTIQREHEQLETVVINNGIDLVISDNRYGCWSANVPSVFITHQSNILMPKRFGWLAPAVGIFHRRLIKKFSQCWIPDFRDGSSLTGKLNKFASRDTTRMKFIGPLSRFKASAKRNDVVYDVALILSGPEPQRSIFEKIIRLQLNAMDIRYCLVRGVINPTVRSIAPNIFDYLVSDELQKIIESSKIVVARSGYSTVMDMAALRKKVIFVPTPGQTEQEYLAKTLRDAGIAFSSPQDQFDLQYALLESQNYTGFKTSPVDSPLLSDAIDELLNVQRLVNIASQTVGNFQGDR